MLDRRTYTTSTGVDVADQAGADATEYAGRQHHKGPSRPRDPGGAAWLRASAVGSRGSQVTLPTNARNLTTADAFRAEQFERGGAFAFHRLPLRSERRAWYLFCLMFDLHDNPARVQHGEAGRLNSYR
jgi:hypothetical protein